MAVGLQPIRIILRHPVGVSNDFRFCAVGVEIGYLLWFWPVLLAVLSFEGSEAHPYLTFLQGGDEVIHLGGNSYSHELVYGILNAMFNENT